MEKGTFVLRGEIQSVAHSDEPKRGGGVQHRVSVRVLRNVNVPSHGEELRFRRSVWCESSGSLGRTDIGDHAGRSDCF